MEIQEMVLRIPGMSEREGRQLASEVSQGLLQHVGKITTGGQIGDIDLQLQVSGELSQQQLARQIVEAIIQRLQTT
ncbi:MAG: hypothetical protein OHK0039_41950 [Bacteroidia bacterium]